MSVAEKQQCYYADKYRKQWQCGRKHKLEEYQRGEIKKFQRE